MRAKKVAAASKKKALDAVRKAFGPSDQIGPCIYDKSKMPVVRILVAGKVKEIRIAGFREEFIDLTPGADNRTWVTCGECNRSWVKEGPVK